jgi:hypothetical protein
MLAAAVPGLRDRLREVDIRTGWAEAVGPDVARRSRPTELRAGVLHVSVDNSPWLSELTLRSDQLLAALRARHGDAVTALRLSIGRVAAPPPPPVSRFHPTARPSLDAEEQRSVETLAASVADPVLADTVRRVMTKDIIARRHRGVPSPARREDT